MAGTQVRCANETGPMSIGENRRDAAASAADGARPAEALKRIRCGGRHTVFAPRHSGRRRNHLSTQLLIYHAGRLHGCGSARRLPWARRAYSYGARRGPLHGFSRATRAAPVAQLDRAPDYESGGQEFESLRARHINTRLRTLGRRVVARKDRFLKDVFASLHPDLAVINLNGGDGCTQAFRKAPSQL